MHELRHVTVLWGAANTVLAMSSGGLVHCYVRSPFLQTARGIVALLYWNYCRCEQDLLLLE